MKKSVIVSCAFALLFSGTTFASHNTSTWDYHPNYQNSNYNLGGYSNAPQAPLININYNAGAGTHSPYNNNYHYPRPTLTTNTATYYSRNFPVTNTYQYVTTPNIGIHHPPYAYSGCAHNCSHAPTQQRITVSRNLGNNTRTYRAPSEYSAQERYVVTPSHNRFRAHNPITSTVNHVSPFRTHKLTTTTCYNCR
jgi:hypothetical protein